MEVFIAGKFEVHKEDDWRQKMLQLQPAVPLEE